MAAPDKPGADPYRNTLADLERRSGARRYVDRALRERRFHAVDSNRAAELDRLQRLEDRLWPQLDAGDLRVAEGEAGGCGAQEAVRSDPDPTAAQMASTFG